MIHVSTHDHWHYGINQHSHAKESRKNGPVKLVKEEQVWFPFGYKTAVGVKDQNYPKEVAPDNGVEIEHNNESLRKNLQPAPEYLAVLKYQ